MVNRMGSIGGGEANPSGSPEKNKRTTAGCASVLDMYEEEGVWVIFSSLGEAQTEYSQQSTPGFGFDCC